MPSPRHSPSNSSPNHRASLGDTIRRGDLKISDPIPFSYNVSTTGAMTVADQFQTPRLDSTWPRKSAPSALQVRRGSSSQAEAAHDLRASAGPSILTSNMSSTASRTSIVQKKNSGFRATIKRVFGSRRNRTPTPQIHTHYHQSDPGNLTMDRNLAKGRYSRRTSPSRKSPATQPHLTDAQVSNEPVPDLPYLDQTVLLHRRRNTLPSIILSDEEAQVLAARIKSPQSSERNHIPCKGSSQHNTQLKRRSRSADALTEIANTPERSSPTRQDRNGEIAYWRNSAIVSPIPKTSRAEITDASHSFTKAMPEQSDWISQTRAPPFETFDFGLESDNPQPASLDDRVNTLEVKMFDFEYALAKIQGIDLPKPNLPLRTPQRRSVNELFPDNSCPSSLTSSVTNETTFLSSPGQSPVTPSDNEDLVRPDRGSKATTIKPNNKRQGSTESQTPSPPSAQMTSNQFETLLALIRDEQAARQQMEMQIMDLRKEVEYLRAPVFASIRTPQYPFNGPESPRSKPLHRSPRFEIQKEPSANETSRFSMTESELETDTEDGFQEVYETPQGNQFAFETPRAAPLAVGMI